MQVVDQGPPLRIVPAISADETNDLVARFGNRDILILRGALEPCTPHGDTLGLDRAREIGIAQRTAIRGAPTFGMQVRDAAGVGCSGLSDEHRAGGRLLLLEIGIGRRDRLECALLECIENYLLQSEITLLHPLHLLTNGRAWLSCSE